MSSKKPRKRMISGKRVADSLGDAVDMTVLSNLQEEQAAGQPDLIVELIDLYLEDTPRRLAAISALLTQRDSLALLRVTHALKGSSVTLGAGRTARLCEAVEHLALDNSLDAVANLLKELHEEFARVRQAFLFERQKRTSPARPPTRFQ